MRPSPKNPGPYINVTNFTEARCEEHGAPRTKCMLMALTLYYTGADLEFKRRW